MPLDVLAIKATYSAVGFFYLFAYFDTKIWPITEHKFYLLMLYSRAE